MRVLFGPFTLDSEARQLLHGAEERHLTPKAFDLLEVLLRERPNAVPKATLLETLWPSTFVVEANLSNLVAELRQALDDDARKPRFVRTVHGRGYAFAHDVRDAGIDTGTGPPSSATGEDAPRRLGRAERVAAAGRTWSGLGTAAAILVALGFAALAGTRAWRGRLSAPSPRVIPLTSTPGDERDVDFSPDGEQIAFSWNGGVTPEGVPVNFDIWLKLVGASEVRRLTTDPRVDRFPAWSPDGKQIAFARGGAAFQIARRTLYLVSPLGGDERKLSDFPAATSQISWSPDGRWLAAGRSPIEPGLAPTPRGIYLVSVADGSVRAITAAEGSAFDAEPAFSPDGSAIAFSRLHDDSGSLRDIHVLPLDRNLVATGPPRVVMRNVPTQFTHKGLQWTRDGESLVYGEVDAFVFRLERVRADGRGPAEAVELAGRGACCPAVAAGRDRLAYGIVRDDNDVFRWHPDRPPEPLLRSSFSDFHPSFSPDGRRIAFSSSRSGHQECWVANADGSGATQLTRGPGGHRGGPRWSPDGTRFVYTAQDDDGRWNVWTMDADGANPRRLTDGPEDSRGEGFSPDGRFVYFSSPGDSRSQIWRVPTGGGPPERVTKDGGVSSAFSPDGRYFVYGKPRPALRGGADLVAVALPDGPERPIACVQQWGFAVTRVGLFYLSCALDRSESPLHVVDLDTGRDRVIGTMPISRLRPLFQGLSVSPDGTDVVFTKYVSEGEDLMMIDNFR